MNGTSSNIISAYRSGLVQTWTQKKMLFFLYAVNLLFAYLVSLPFNAMVERALDHSVMAEKLLHAFDFTALAGMIDEYGRGVKLSWNILVFAVCYGVLHTFFSGGIIRIFSSGINFKFGEFWNGCVEYFSRFFRLLLLGCGVIILTIILYLLISGLLNRLTENAASEFWPFIITGFKLLFLLILLAWISLFLDYARIGMVLRDNSKIFQSCRETAHFVLKNFMATALLFACLALTGLIILLAYLGLESLLPKDSALAVLLFFIIAQLYVISRLWLRLNFYSVQLAYYLKDRPS